MNYRERELTRFAAHFDTDKLGHGYIPHYAEQLPDRCASLLEIGVYKGASALMWDSFFGQSFIDLYFLDLYKDVNTVPARWVRNNGWVPIIGDQSDLTVLASIQREFEVIIDDGSHNAHHQLISFKHLFFNNVVPGGLYVIEDLHCNKDSFYYGGYVRGFNDTPLAMLKKFCNEGVIDNVYFNEGESEVFKSIIESVKIFDEKIAFITRKK